MGAVGHQRSPLVRYLPASRNFSEDRPNSMSLDRTPKFHQATRRDEDDNQEILALKACSQNKPLRHPHPRPVALRKTERLRRRQPEHASSLRDDSRLLTWLPRRMTMLPSSINLLRVTSGFSQCLHWIEITEETAQ